MTILIVHCELNRSDTKSLKTRESVFKIELSKGRRSDQISSNGSTFFVHTPESALILLKRLIENCILNKEKDRLSITDAGQGKVYIWGRFDEDIRTKFPFLVEECGT